MSATLAEGTVFAGRYRIVRRIAAGGMGAVYEAVHVETGRRRALKVMHPHVLQSDELRARFKQEARIAAQIESEHIVDVSDAGVDEATDTPFLVMELLRGEELSRRIKRAGPLAPAEAVAVLGQMALALDRTHAASIVHRDIKPENVFLCQRDDGSTLVKILDFGVAKLVADASLTGGATQSLGTPLYMAPEQFRASRVLSPAADVYSLGLLAYTMLVGHPYWRKESRETGEPFAFAFVAIQGPREPPSLRAAEIGIRLPPAFDAWFARVTALDPAARIVPATEVARTFAEALDVALPGQRTSLPSLPFPGAAAPSSTSGRTEILAPAPSPSAEEATSAAPTLVRLPPEPDRSSTQAALTAPSRGAPRGSIAAIVAAVAVAVVAAVAWIGIRTSADPGAAATAPASTSTPVTTAPSAAPSGDDRRSPEPAPSAPAPAVSPSPTSSSDARPEPRPSAEAPPAARPVPRPAAPPVKPRTTAKPLPGLLGRD